MRNIYITESQFKRIVSESLFNPRYNGLRDTLNFGALSKAAIQNGFTLIGYHNTKDKDIYKNGFIARNSGIHFGSLKAAKDRSLYRDSWQYYDDDVPTYTYKFFLKVRRPLVIEQDFDWEGETFDDWNSPDDDSYNEDIDIYHYLKQMGFEIMEYDENGEPLCARHISQILADKGYDAIIYKNQVEDKGKYSIAMFNPCNIKLAKNTFDDSGNPIPLEQRFNTNTSDTRY